MIGSPSSSTLAVFQSALPLRGATRPCNLTAWSYSEFQSALPLRGATVSVVETLSPNFISIRAPLAGSDNIQDAENVQLLGKFQSALPLRGAISHSNLLIAAVQFQSALPLRGAIKAGGAPQAPRGISIRAPLAGSDRRSRAGIFREHVHFNPRSPCGERYRDGEKVQRLENFNPRSPCGER